MKTIRCALAVLFSLMLALGLALPAMAANAAAITEQPQDVTVRPGESFTLRFEIGDDGQSHYFHWYCMADGQLRRYWGEDTATSSALTIEVKGDPYQETPHDPPHFPHPKNIFSGSSLEYYCIVDEGLAGEARSRAATVTVKPGFTDFLFRLFSGFMIFPFGIFVNLITGPFALFLLFLQRFAA